MKVWDMHCDTLNELRKAELAGTPMSFEQNDLAIDLQKLQKGDYLLQCFACFVNLGRDTAPLQAMLQETDIFYRLLAQYPQLMQVKTPEDIRALAAGNGKIGAMLTVEEGAVCLDDLSILRDIYRLGVRMMTLTWNYKNGLANPNSVPGDAANVWPCAANTADGLTEKGFAFVAEMERLHMILDVSHLSDAGFWDIAKCSTRPFVASHSNARSLCGHVRNLTDEMIAAMAEKGGLIGLNYCCSFLDANPDRTKVKSRISDMVRHALHIMDVGGEDILALGSDFDGIEGDLELTGAGDMQKLAEGFVAAGFTPRLAEKILSGNAVRFFEENL